MLQRLADGTDIVGARAVIASTERQARGSRRGDGAARGRSGKGNLVNVRGKDDALQKQCDYRRQSAPAEQPAT
jgi:hypothetical protein